jgi:hypothetical protein
MARNSSFELMCLYKINTLPKDHFRPISIVSPVLYEYAFYVFYTVGGFLGRSFYLQVIQVATPSPQAIALNNATKSRVTGSPYFRSTFGR